jgi:MinD-like ATPase involved in chromosome partitioning or flagellar assembly
VVIACWSAKGGSGTTVVAASLAIATARRGVEVLLVDLAGDVPAALGLEPSPAGIADWCRAGDDVPADALARLEREVAPGLHLLERGGGGWPAVATPSGGDPTAPTGATLAATLDADARTVVVDCGTIPLADSAELPLVVASSATRSVLVIRPCYLALRRAQVAPLHPSHVVVVREPGRALDALDVEAVLGVPVLAEVAVDPAVARAVDAGVLRERLPRAIERTFRRAA